MSTIKSGSYVGATASELGDNTAADKVAGGVSQKSMFRRRGTIRLTDEALVLDGWDGELVLTRDRIASVRTEYTKLYGRFIGGLLNSGKPLIIDVVGLGEIYLLVDRREIMESTKDREWAKAIKAWL